MQGMRRPDQLLTNAEDDVRRLRAACLRIAREEPEHEVALGMVGADLERARLRLQELAALENEPEAPARSTVVHRLAAGRPFSATA